MTPRRTACFFIVAAMTPAALHAAIYTVGPGGTHATIQAAVDTARLTMFDDDEVRIARGTWNEHVQFGSPYPDRLDISGGWNATFDVQTVDPALTVIDGGHNDVAFSMGKFDGVATLRNLTFARGRYASTWGASLVVSTQTWAHVEISDCIVRDGELLPPANLPGRGGGAFLNASGMSELVMERCEVRDNKVQTEGESGWGGGIYVRASGDAKVRLGELDVHHNTVTGPYGMAGIAAEVRERAQLEVFDSVFADNAVVNDSELPSISSGVAFYLNGEADASRLEFRRNRVLRNNVQTGSPATQVVVSGGGSANAVIADSVIADSTRDGGLTAVRADTAAVSLVNLTLAGNAGTDLTAWSGVTVSNTLADSTNAGIVAATVVNSRLGEDPGYVDRAAGDYRLQAGSPAINAGTSSPAGGLGLLDVEGNARVRGHRVDQGAYEADSATIFVDGFEEP